MPTTPALLSRRIHLALSAVVLALGLVGGLLATAGDATARVPARSGVYFGGVGDSDILTARTREPLASHTYGYFESRTPSARMISVKFRNYKSWAATAALSPGSTGYRQIAAWADALKQRRGEVLVAFHHEPEASGNRKYGTSGDYRRAYRKVVSIFNARGASNVSWTWQMTSHAFRTDPGSYTYAPKWYPGDGYVDVVGPDPYNWYRCGHGVGRWLSLKDLTEPAMKFARSHGKQLALPEFASVANSRRPAWLRDAGQYLAANDSTVVAAFYFNRTPTNRANSECIWRLTTDADFAAWREVTGLSVMKN
jgi:hypothetical protein